MPLGDAARFAQVGDAYVDSQRNLLDSLHEAGILKLGSVVGLHAMLDQVAASLKESHKQISADLLDSD